MDSTSWYKNSFPKSTDEKKINEQPLETRIIEETFPGAILLFIFVLFIRDSLFGILFIRKCLSLHELSAHGFLGDKKNHDNLGILMQIM